MRIEQWTTYVLKHEILHALGWVHEHTRKDRDAFVKIIPDYPRI